MAGAGYKLFNTGDVLTAAQVNTYLMEQTVMVFADATARTTALSGVVAEGMLSYLKSTKQVEVYNGSAWVASDDPNAIQNTIVDAKGDLISASAADTPARLAVGNNGDTLVADSSASTGLRWQGNFAAGKNAIINGAFDIWQRGTSFTNPGAAYTTDRFYSTFDGTGATRTISRQTFSPGTAPVAGYEGSFFYRYDKSVGGTGGSIDYPLLQRIEDVRKFAGQTVTVSFWAKANANRSITGYLTQNFGSGGSSDVNYGFTAFSVTTSWQRFTQTITLNSLAGKTIGTNSFLLFATYTENVNATFTLDFWGVQVEAGSVATAFQTATGTLAGELSACRRYLPCLDGNNSDQIMGYAYASNAVVYGVQFDVPARVAPTGITPSGTINGFGLNTQYAITPTYNTSSVNGCSILGTSGVTITAGQGSRLYMASGSKILFTGCEL